MGKQKEISVIVAAYNQEKYIGRCLRSLLNQNFPHCDYEILVVYDGSNDRTAYALELFSDSGDSLVQVITHTRNRGLPASLNSAINVSSSKYIVRADADDFVNSNFLNLLHYYLEQIHTEMQACDYFLVDDNGMSLNDVIALINLSAAAFYFLDLIYSMLAYMMKTLSITRKEKCVLDLKRNIQYHDSSFQCIDTEGMEVI